MCKFGFIGIGNMGYAMLSGALNIYPKDAFRITDANQTRLEEISATLGVQYTQDNLTLAQNTKYILLAIKPIYYERVLKEIAPVITKNHVLISITPGIHIDEIKEIINVPVRVIRAMPNTPALVGEGMTVASYSQDEYLDEEKNELKSFFESFGKLLEVEEKYMDSVVPISGSSPAYVFVFIEALADGGVRLGLSREQAYLLAAQSVLGSAKMVLETKLHPGILKDQVCSPGGTTIEAIATLEKEGFRNAVLEAMDACYKKCVGIK